MKLGVTILPDSGRISPMLEASERLIVLRCCHGNFSQMAELALPGDEFEKIECLCQTGIGLLICGAAANDTCVRLNQCGIKVCPFVSGDWNEFLKEFLSNAGHVEKYVMPGCCLQHGRCCGKHQLWNEENEIS